MDSEKQEGMNQDNEAKNFQQKKVISLNHFFMKHIFFGNLFTLLFFLLTITVLILLLGLGQIDEGLKITLISMMATFVLTTSKTIIDKAISITQYLTSLLGEEQRGLNKNLGIEIEKIELDRSDDSHEHDDTKVT